MTFIITVLCGLYLGVRYLFKQNISQKDNQQELIVIAVAFGLSVVGNALLLVNGVSTSFLVDLILCSMIIIQAHYLLKTNNAVSIKIGLLIALLVLLQPYFSGIAVLIVGSYFIILGYKQANKTPYYIIGLTSVVASVSIYLQILLPITLGSVIYFCWLHVQHSNQLLSMMKNAGKNVITDALTGLYNRRWLYRKAEDMAAKQKIGIIFCDIDNFKILNDTKGHEYGDYVLQKAGEIMRREFKNKAFPARYGGEELVAIVMNPADSVKLAERLLVCLKKELDVTMSIGVSEGQGNAEDIIKVADARMYIAKKSGKNRVVAIDKLEVAEGM
jgi:diguanylate cyclase (GGDEF)-like protein